MHGLSLSVSQVRASGAAEQTHGERDQEENDEDAEQNLRDAGRCTGNAAEAEHTGDQSYDEKYEGIVKHGNVSLFRCRKNVPSLSLFRPEPGLKAKFENHRDEAQKAFCSGNLIGCSALSGDTLSNPLDPMTEHSKKAPVSNGLPGMAAFHPGVSAQLREYYQSVQEEGIPERFLQLLERLDMAERQAGADIRVKDTAR